MDNLYKFRNANSDIFAFDHVMETYMSPIK